MIITTSIAPVCIHTALSPAQHAIDCTSILTSWFCAPKVGIEHGHTGERYVRVQAFSNMLIAIDMRIPNALHRTDAFNSPVELVRIRAGAIESLTAYLQNGRIRCVERKLVIGIVNQPVTIRIKGVFDVYFNDGQLDLVFTKKLGLALF